MDRYDYIIAGAGAAGLSLAYHLVQAGLRDKKILLLDRAPKAANDRTWCFWESGEGPFERAVFRRWDQVWFHGEGFSGRLDIRPYRYKMLRGADFYGFMNRWLAQQPNVTVRYGEVGSIEESGGAVKVWLGDEAVEGEWAFSSLYRPAPARPGFHHLLQHFKGWVVQTPQAAFDPSAATFMDFRVEQHGETRFAYVLPFDERTALVEYTLFSPELLPDAEYDLGLRAYLRDFLGLGDYRVMETEFGVIPMTDAPFAVRRGERVMNIGTAGGRTKASTGYTFQRIQRQSRRITESLIQSGQPFYPEPAFSRHAWMDSVLLNVLQNHRDRGGRVFADLFRRNPPARVLRFLDEETGLLDDLRIMASVNLGAFGAGALAVTRRGLLGRPSPLHPGANQS